MAKHNSSECESELPTAQRVGDPKATLDGTLDGNFSFRKCSKCGIPTSSPVNIVPSFVTKRSVSFRWEPPPYDDQNGVIILYTFNIIVLETEDSFQLNSSTTTLTVTSLRPFRTYECSIAAATSVGLGPFSTSIIVMTLDDYPGAPPQQFSGRVTSSTSAYLSWSPPPYEEQNGVIIQYIISVTVQETGERFQLTSETTYLEVTNLRPYRTYVCVIAAATSVGLGPFSDSLTLKTPQDVPGVPRNVTATLAESSSVSVEWELPEEHNGVLEQCQVVYYQILLVTLFNDPGFLGNGTVSAETKTYSISIPNPGTYGVKVRCSTSVGYGNFTDPVVVEIPDDNSRSSSAQGGSSNESGEIAGIAMGVISAVVLCAVVVTTVAIFVIRHLSGKAQKYDLSTGFENKTALAQFSNEYGVPTPDIQMDSTETMENDKSTAL